MMRKSFVLFCLAGCMALPLLASNERPLTLVVPTAAGGGNDAMARTIGQKLGTLLNRSVIVENRAGANGALASEFVAKAQPDGNTLLFGYVATHAMNPALQKLRYDPVKDFEPVGLVGYSPTLMVVNPSLRVKDVKDLVRVLKEKPDQFSVASAGNGTAPHFAAELFKLSTQTSLLHVPYKGSAPAINDTIGGQTHVMFPSLFTGAPFVKTGRLQALAIAGQKRSAVLPEVPTLKELGVEGVEVDQWYAIFAPSKTPKDVVNKLNQALNKVLNDKDIIQRIESHGADVETSTPEQLAEMVRKDLIKWRQVVQRAKLQAD
jgi:tripartite-type tricarboxylate transporter receptor subunit TctC